MAVVRYAVGKNLYSDYFNVISWIYGLKLGLLFIAVFNRFFEYML